MLSHFYNPVVGSEQGGWQPVLIVSNDIGNRHSPTVIILPNNEQSADESEAAHLYRGKQCGGA